eukprot:scaffold133672_cov37-Cyclotella_meneghiniana.AAC.1
MRLKRDGSSWTDIKIESWSSPHILLQLLGLTWKLFFFLSVKSDQHCRLVTSLLNGSCLIILPVLSSQSQSLAARLILGLHLFNLLLKGIDQSFRGNLFLTYIFDGGHPFAQVSGVSIDLRARLRVLTQELDSTVEPDDAIVFFDLMMNAERWKSRTSYCWKRTSYHCLCCRCLPCLHV